MPRKGRQDYLRKIRKWVRETKSLTLSEFYDKCPYAQYEEIVMWSPTYQELIKSSLALEKKYQLECQYKNRFQWALSFASPVVHPTVHAEIENILKLNRIDILEFAQSVRELLEMTKMKVNSLRLWGSPNSGKTLLANCIVRPFITCYMNNHGSENEFFISNMLNKAVILCEELYITIATAEDFKSVLGGQPIDIAKKYEEKQILQRTPVIITSNYEKFGRGHLNSTDEKALSLRCVNFQFTRVVEPQCVITAEDFWKWMTCVLGLK